MTRLLPRHARARSHTEPSPWRRTFSSLSVPNYRRFFEGQSVSLIGTWMQSVAQSWLVLELTHSGTILGFVVAVQTVPVLLLAPYGGLVVDRVDKRRLLLVTQSVLASLALTLGILVVTHSARLWMVIAVAAGLGTTNAFDNPGRQAFVPEMVGPEGVPNAVSLNSVLTNSARAVGPAVAGVLIASVGVGLCFLLNAASFVAVIIAVYRIDPRRLHRGQPAPRTRGQVVEGLRYVRRTPPLLVPLLMMGLIGALAYEFQVVLPLVAQRTFHGGAATYGYLSAAFGAGAIVGGLFVASRPTKGLRAVVLAAVLFGMTLLIAASAPRFWSELMALGCVGAGSVAFMSRANSTLQLSADDQMRGRVMALWAVAFSGTTPIGGPIDGYVAQEAGPRWGLALGGFSALIAAALALLARNHFHTASKQMAAPDVTDQLPPGAGPS